MRAASKVYLSLVVAMFAVGCKKDEKEKGKLSASIKKSETIPGQILLPSGTGLLDGTGSSVQSFTPTSLKASIFRVTACPSGSTTCTGLYTCEANTYEDCAVELSDIEAFTDAINASEIEAEDGATFDSVSVSFCPNGTTDSTQHIWVTGTVDILGTTYATDPDLGLVEGTSGKEIPLTVTGGCGVIVDLDQTATISKDDPTKITLFFDSSLFAIGGVPGGSSHVTDYSYPDDGPGCVGTQESAFVCVPGLGIVPTVDEGNPTTEHYLMTDTTESQGSSATSSPSGLLVLYFGSDGQPIGGIESSYRMAGADVDFGGTMGGGLGFRPTVVDTNTLEFGKPGGDVPSLAEWFQKFKRETHSGEYTFNGPGNVETAGTYTATKLD